MSIPPGWWPAAAALRSVQCVPESDAESAARSVRSRTRRSAPTHLTTCSERSTHPLGSRNPQATWCV